MHRNYPSDHHNLMATSEKPISEQYIVVIEPHFALFRYLKVIHEQGYRTLVLSSNPEGTLAGEEQNAFRFSTARGTQIDQIVRYEKFDVESLLQAIAPYSDRIAGVVAGEDAAVPIASELGRNLGFDYALAEDAHCQHIKTAMKQRMVEQGVSTPPFVVARNIEEATEAWERFGCDCMVKMVDFAASLNIFRATTRSELETAWDTIHNNQRRVETFFALSRDIILEEFVGGRELSVEGFVNDDCITVLNFSEKLTESNFIVVGHYIPACLTTEEERQLIEISKQCIRALGLRNSVFHIEIHIRDGIPYIIECAARPPGQHTVELIERTYGIDLMKISIQLATGNKVNITRKLPRVHHAILALYTKTSGTLKRVEGIEELRNLNGLVHLGLDAKIGDPVEALDTFRNKYGMIILEADSPQALREKAVWVRENVHMIV